MTMLTDVDQFLKNILGKLVRLGINVQNYELDHIGYQTSSDRDYDRLLPKFKDLGEMLSEEIVGGRRVAILKLDEPITYKDYTIPAIELIAPRQGQVCPSALEHAEFVLDTDFDTFLKEYPDIEWDTSAVDQKDFPMLKLKLGDNIQVKFHLENVLDIIAGK